MDTKNQYTFRRIADAVEMQRALELRYETYSRAFPNTIADNCNTCVEVDAYDLHAIHWGLFDDATGDLAGYFRLIFDSRFGIPEHCKRHSVGTLNPIYKCLAKNNDLHVPLPLYYLGDVPEGEKRELLTGWVDERSSIVSPMTEVSRLIIAPEYRNGNAVKYMVAAIFALFPYLEIPFALFQCDPKQVSIYRRYGLDSIEDGVEFNCHKYGDRHMMFGEYHSYSPAFKKMIENMVRQYRTSDSCAIAA